MTRDMRSYGMKLPFMGLALIWAVVGCGGDEKSDKQIDDPAKDAGGDDEKDSGAGGENTGGDNTGGTTGTTRMAVTDGPNCAEDVASTPGTECADYVNCGGTLEQPHVCPTTTHSCCVSGLPVDATVNCYEGTTACKAAEAITPCDGPEDCSGGKVCCVTPPSGQVITECRDAAGCDEPSEGTMFCHTDADCPGSKSCTPPQTSPWWGFCN